MRKETPFDDRLEKEGSSQSSLTTRLLEEGDLKLKTKHADRRVNPGKTY